MIASAVATGDLHRVHRGVFARPGTHPLLIAAARHGGSPACVTAASIRGLWVLDPAGVHVLMGTDGHVLRSHLDCTCVEHWDGPRLERGRMLNIAECLPQIAHCQGAEAFFVSLESALALHRLHPSQVMAMAAALPPAVRRILPLARTDSGSGTESLFFLRMRRHRLPMTSQPAHPAGGRSDFRIGERLLIEIDSEAHHGGTVQRRRDLERDAAAALCGFETLRFDYAQVRGDWDMVEQVVLAKGAAGDHRWR